MKYLFVFIIVLTSFKGENDLEVTQMTLGGNAAIQQTEEEACFGCGDCSIYCAIENTFTVTSSSSLTSEGKNSYQASNIDDYNLHTAWVEGVEGSGINEWVEFRFDPKNWQDSKLEIDGLFLYNGYRKSPKSWKENARIKQLKVSINGNDFKLLELHDAVNQQSISFEPIALSTLQTIRFTILEVYEGEKYQDTALSELRLSGKHHH